MGYTWTDFQQLNVACERLFNNKFLSDIKFQFPCDKVLYAHSLLLSLRGEGFHEAFKDAMGATKLITVEHISFESFFELLECIYASRECNITEQNCLEIKKLSELYGVHDVHAKATEFIVANLKVDNVFKILQKSLEEKWTILEDHVMHFIQDNAKRVFNSPSLCKISKSTLDSILRWSFLGIGMTEVDVFKAVMRWATNACDAKGIELTGQSKRSILGATLKLVGFPLMSASEFSECIKMHPKLLDENEITAIFMSISTKQVNSMGFLDYKRFNWKSSSKVVINHYDNMMDHKAEDDHLLEFTVSKAIDITALYYFQPKGLTTICIFTDKGDELYRKASHAYLENIWIDALDHPVRLENGQEYKISFTFSQLESENIKGFKVGKLPATLKGGEHITFNFSSISPNIVELYYNVAGI